MLQLFLIIESLSANYSQNDNNNNNKESQLQEEAAAVKDQSKEDTSGEASEDLEAILENNLKQDDFEFSLDSPLSILLDDNEDLELLNDMMIQPSTAHFQHPRQPNQNYAHCVNSYRQNSYQVSVWRACERIIILADRISKVHATKLSEKSQRNQRQFVMVNWIMWLVTQILSPGNLLPTWVEQPQERDE